ncbi:MAG: c-type cytochrome [Betaproteobacteria bacterium]
MTSLVHALDFLRLPVVLTVVAVWVALGLRRAGSFTWAVACWAGLYAILRFAFVTPIPSSVVRLYMGIVTLALAAYVSSGEARRREFLAPLVALAVERRYRWLLGAVLVLLPAAAAANAYLGTRTKIEPPVFGRTVHPAPPESITVHDHDVDLVHGKNPFRELERTDPAQFQAHVENGRRTYYRNCVFCHGDAMTGDGLYAHGLNPIPTNFTEGTIEQLQESYLFWRISKGGPGLPAEGGPWDSAMPAWESFLSEQEIWEVITFLYDFTGKRPRAAGEVQK